jgi:hypothetical protein
MRRSAAPSNNVPLPPMAQHNSMQYGQPPQAHARSYQPPQLMAQQQQMQYRAPPPQMQPAMGNRANQLKISNLPFYDHEFTVSLRGCRLEIGS